MSRVERATVGYALLFALPAGVASASLVDGLGPVSAGYTLLAGATTTLLVFGFVVAIAATGEPEERRSETP